MKYAVQIYNKNIKAKLLTKLVGVRKLDNFILIPLAPCYIKDVKAPITYHK